MTGLTAVLLGEAAGVLLPYGGWGRVVCKTVWVGGKCQSEIHVNTRVQVFPAEHGSVTRWAVLLILPVSGFGCYGWSAKSLSNILEKQQQQKRMSRYIKATFEYLSLNNTVTYFHKIQFHLTKKRETSLQPDTGLNACVLKWVLMFSTFLTSCKPAVWSSAI